MREIRKRDNINLKRNYETFIEYIDVSQKTIDSYKNGLKSLFEYLETHNITNPTRNDIKAFRDYLILNSSANTVNSYMTSVREFFKYLATYDMYENVAKDIKGAKTSTTPKKQVLSEDKVVEIYNALTDKREKALFGLLITTGLRGIEVTNAMIEDLKYHNEDIVLWVQCKGHSSKDEYVKISEQVFNDIKDYVGERTHGFIFVGTGNKNNGNQLTTKTIRLIIKNIFKRFGLDEDGFSLHSTRRTFSTIAYNNGADIYSIQQVLHHKSINTTTIYLKSADRNKNNTEQRVSNCIFKEV